MRSPFPMPATVAPRRLALALLALALVAIALGACTRETPEQRANREAYVRYCAACHGEDGEGIPGLPIVSVLASDDLLTLVDDAFLAETIARGRPGISGREKPGTKMSPLGAEHRGPLSDEEIAGIVAHVRGWQEGPSVALDESYVAEGDPEAGRAAYEVHCAACHGPDGWGELAPRLAGEVLQDTASDAFLRETVRLGRTGTTMRAYGEAEIDDATLDGMIVYIRQLGAAGAAGADGG